MRLPVIVCAALSVIITTAIAQQPTQSPATPPVGGTPAPAAVDPVLDGYLKRWEEEMRKITSLSANLARIDTDKTFKTTTKFTGFAVYSRTGTGANVMNKAVLQLNPEGKTDYSEKFVCTGTHIYQFAPAQKEIRAYEIPRPKVGQMADDNFLAFLVGMKADDAKRLYELKLHNVDKHYAYIDIAPRFQAQKADFSKARLILLKDTCMPRMLWFEHTNKNEVTWDIPRMETNVRLDEKWFSTPATPTGWKLVVVNTKNMAQGNGVPPPNVVRPGKP